MKTIINRQKSYGGWILLKTFVLCLFLLFGVMVQTLGAESGDIKVDGIYYHISNNGTASVIASLQNSYGGNVVIPESLLYQGEKYIVRGISEKSFYNCRYLTSVSIPSSITNIGNNAFYNCNALSAVYITDLEAWCNIRFDNSANPLSCAHDLFLNGEVIENLVIPDGMTTIGNNVFRGCSMKTVVIPSSVKSIGDNTFAGCSNLITLNIPNNVTSIGSRAFSGCTSMEKIILSESLKELPAYCFSGCESLLSIKIPQNVKRIGTYCFNNCRELRRVIVLSEDSCVLEGGCFWFCDLLNDFIIHAKIPPEIKFEKYYFRDDYFLKDQFYTKYGSGKKNLYVPSESFEDYKNSELWGQWKNIMTLEDVDEDEEVSGNLTKQSDNKYYSKGLYYTLDEDAGTASLVDVGDWFFAGSPSPAIEDSREEISYVNVPEQVSYEWKVYTMTSIGDLCFSGYKYLYKIVIPSTVKSLGIECFSGTWGLSTVTLPDELESLGNSCFFWSGIQSIDIPPLVTSIGQGCFSESGLRKVIIRSNNLKTISKFCFSDCSNLSEFVCYADEVPEIDSEGIPFYGTKASEGTLYVKKELVDAYKATPGWNVWKNIRPIDASEYPDGINNLISEVKNKEDIYDLQGRKVTTPQKNGLYIKNGKKFILR